MSTGSSHAQSIPGSGTAASGLSLRPPSAAGFEPHEIYGFEPAIVLGGKIRLENVVKVNANVHLTILRQFAEPSLPLSGIDIEKLLDS